MAQTLSVEISCVWQVETGPTLPCASSYQGRRNTPIVLLASTAVVFYRNLTQIKI